MAEAARQFHAEYAARQKKNAGDSESATRRLNRISVQIQRLTDALTESDTPVKELVEKLKALEAERVSLGERLRLIEAESNVVRLHPSAIEAYKANVETLHASLSKGGYTIENRAAFRNLIDCVVVHPTPKRAPYEVTPYAHLGAIMGIDLSPAARTPTQIIDEEGVPTGSRAPKSRTSI
jgi:site-specific DNA recombinase